MIPSPKCGDVTRTQPIFLCSLWLLLTNSSAGILHIKMQVYSAHVWSTWVILLCKWISGLKVAESCVIYTCVRLWECWNESLKSQYSNIPWEKYVGKNRKWPLKPSWTSLKTPNNVKTTIWKSLVQCWLQQTQKHIGHCFFKRLRI